jgi:periplasmic protein TonB
MLQNWNNITFDSRNDIVFEGRNREYGAYVLRRSYNMRVTLIIGGVVAFSLLLLGLKKFMDRPKDEIVEEKLVTTQIDLTPPPPVEDAPPPPPPPPPPPMVEMVKFVPPVIKDDAVEDQPQKTIDDVRDVNVGTKDQEGDKDIIAPPTEDKGATEPAGPQIFTIVEEQAEFPGGISEMAKFIQKNLQYPAIAREAGISGKCFLKFVVNENGDISNVEVLKGVPGCSDCDKEAIRVVKSMPKWRPAKMTGKEVKCYFNLPISFKIQ